MEALAGINAGDGLRFVTIPGSLTTGIINIDQTTNVGTPGVWMFRIDTGKLIRFCLVYGDFLTVYTTVIIPKATLSNILIGQHMCSYAQNCYNREIAIQVCTEILIKNNSSHA